MDRSLLFLILSLAFWLLYCASLFSMVHYIGKKNPDLSRQGFSFFKTPKYLKAYREETIRERGRTGPAWYIFYLSATLLLIAAILGIAYL